MKQKSSGKEQRTSSSKGDSIVPFVPFAIIMNTIFQGMGGVIATAARETLWHKTLVKDYELLKNRESVKSIKSLKIYKIIQKKYNIDWYLIAIFILFLSMISASFILVNRWGYCGIGELSEIIINIKNYTALSCLGRHSLLLLAFSFLFIIGTSIFWQKKASLGNIKSYVILIHQDRFIFIVFNFIILFLIMLAGLYYYEDFVKDMLNSTDNYDYKKYLIINITPMILLLVFIYCTNAIFSLFYAIFLYRSIHSNQALKEGYENFLRASAFSEMWPTYKLNEGHHE